MSFHGGLLGIIIATIFFSKKNNLDKLIIDKANFSHNNYRDDLFDPQKYQNGKSIKGKVLVRNRFKKSENIILFKFIR